MFLHLLCAVLMGSAALSVAASGGFSEYSDVNRVLFVHPRSSAVAGGDLAFRRDGRTGTPASNLALDAPAQLDLSYTGYYRNLFSVSGLGYVASLDAGQAIGVSLGYLLVPAIQLTTGLETDYEGNPVFDPSRIQYASMSEFEGGFSYGRGLVLPSSVRLGLGGTISLTRRKLPDSDGRHVAGYGIGVDVSVSAAFDNPGIRGVLLVENATGSHVSYADEGYTHRGYPHVRVGLGWERDVDYFSGDVRVVYATPDLLSREGANARSLPDRVHGGSEPRELALTRDPQFLLYGSLGAQVSFAGRVTVRGGIREARDPVFGAGLTLPGKQLHIDIAYLHHTLDGSYSAALSWQWH